MISKFTAKLVAGLMITIQLLGGYSTVAEAATSSSTSDSEKAALMQKYAPKVYFHKDEKYFPGDVNDWLDGVAMRYLLEDNRKYIGGEVLWGGDIKFTKFLDPETNQELAVTPDNIASFTHNGSSSSSDRKFFLQRTDDSVQYGDNDGEVNSPIYTRFYEGTNYNEITYLFWYPHNGNMGPDAVDAASHQGDWERIMVVLDKSGNMVSAKYNAHGDEHEWFAASELEYDGTHPIVYSGLDSHASYTLNSATSTSTNHWKVDRPAGTVLLLPDDHISKDGQTWQSWNNIVELTDQNWLNYRGRWGSVSTEYKDGPYGPSASAGSDLSSGENKIVFYQRDNCIGNMRAMWNIDGDATYNIKGDVPSGRKKLANDAIRSVKLLKVKAGTLITLYDNPDGSKRDDYVEIYVKRDISQNIKINKLEDFVSNEDVYVLPHLYNGLTGKISRVEVKRNVTRDSVAVFYEGNNASQDIVGSEELTSNKTLNLQNHIIENDEIRSMVIKDAKAGTLLTFYDSPNGSTGDDWTQVYVKRNTARLQINSFENYYNSNDMVILPHRKNGIDGKISRIVVQKNASFNHKGVVELYEGNNVSQDRIGTLPIQRTRINFKKHSIDNDEARSLKLRNCPAGTKLRLYDNPDGKWNDDICFITVKKDITSYNINTFERSYEDAYVKVEFRRKNGLDGKVSRIEID